MVLKNITTCTIQQTFYGSCPYGQLVVRIDVLLLGYYKGWGMMIVRCSTAPLMIITLVHLISMRTLDISLHIIFGIDRNTKSCPLVYRWG
jgi:hypothetical protein